MSEVFPESEVIQEYDDGMALLYVTTKRDLQTLSDQQGHCSYAHYYWCDGLLIDPVTYFFVVESEGVAKVTAHSKKLEWFGKPHPKDDTPEMLTHCAYRGFHIKSNYYDGRGVPNQRPNDSYYRRDLEYYQAEYARIKRDALEIGPLGRDNPLKFDLDNMNKKVTQYKGLAEKEEAQNRLYKGRTFGWREQRLVLLGVTTVGLSYTGCDSRYGDKLDEFFGKELVLDDPA